MTLAVAIPACCSSQSEIRVGYVLESLALQTAADVQFEVFLRDEGAVPIVSDRWTRLMVDMLGALGHSFNYFRRNASRGVAVARRELLEQVPERYDRVLLLDDDMVLLPRAIGAILEAAEQVQEYGFIQGTKLELDASREYANDINVMNRHSGGELKRIYFGDAAFLLVRRDAFSRVRWDIITRFQERNMAGEDVALSLMIADQFPCYGVPQAVGYHMSLERPRWKWEASSDALQLEILRGIVSHQTLKLALPHLAQYIDGGDSDKSGAAG